MLFGPTYNCGDLTLHTDRMATHFKQLMVKHNFFCIHYQITPVIY